MTFTQAIASGFHKYIAFSGRASRSEYWYWVLFNFLVNVAGSIVDLIVFRETDLSPVNTLVTFGLLLPSLAVTFRRLHDIGRTAWWFLLAFTGIGLFVLIYWHCLKGTAGPNMYGEDPLANSDRTRW